MRIYKILRASEWAELQAKGEIPGAPIDVSDGFVHFSTADQAQETAAKHFAGETGLILAALEADDLGDALKWEVSRGGAEFPHLYAPLRMSDVIWHAGLPLEDGTHVFPESVAGHVDPTRAQFDTFKALDRDQPIEMLNLVRLRERAAYASDHPLAGDGLSGAEAYANYGRDTQPILERLGGLIVWRGRFQGTLIGPADEQWDLCFVARYPTAHAFLEMVTDPDYREAAKHRQAAVLTSRLIRTAPSKGGASFG
ncbi:DUF952 domain-containing protein [Rhodobacterales bacterium HKCCE4037]|nr:DUF952 domain-containing protein [Rhodobacterales bacterium HKCCE4037]